MYNPIQMLGYIYNNIRKGKYEHEPDMIIILVVSPI